VQVHYDEGIANHQSYGRDQQARRVGADTRRYRLGAGQLMSPCVQMLWGERRGHGTIGAIQRLPMELPMSQHCHFDASRSLTALEQDSTIIAVIEMSQTKWLVAHFYSFALAVRTSDCPKPVVRR
jgi:hypothetical protein